MALNTYCVRFTVPAPPCYAGDPYQRIAIKERFIVSGHPDDAARYVADDLRDKGVSFGDMSATFMRRYTPD